MQKKKLHHVETVIENSNVNINEAWMKGTIQGSTTSDDVFPVF